MIVLCIILVVLLIALVSIIIYFKRKLKRIQSGVYANYEQKTKITNASIIQTKEKEPLLIDRNLIHSLNLNTEEKEETERALKRRRALYCQ